MVMVRVVLVRSDSGVVSKTCDSSHDPDSSISCRRIMTLGHIVSSTSVIKTVKGWFTKEKENVDGDKVLEEHGIDMIKRWQKAAMVSEMAVITIQLVGGVAKRQKIAKLRIGKSSSPFSKALGNKTPIIRTLYFPLPG